MSQIYDLAIIGGGVNGAGIARDAAGRGASVILFEQDDLASHTSSWSTKLIHGGLRYLEYYEFRLVREALMEREVLWKIAPHIIEPLRFVLPHHRGLRPAWLLRLGLFLYDHLGGRKLLPATRTLDLTRDVAGQPLKKGLFSRGFEYSDCRVDDSRLVLLNAQDAAARGAAIRTRSRVVSAARTGDHWTVEVENRLTGARETIAARALVNAAGPWVAEVLGQRLHAKSRSGVRLVQGSHIVVPKLYDHDRCYIFQNSDGRIIFAIPYQGDFTLIGTTDSDYSGDPAAAHATQDEIAYLCRAASEYFAQPVEPASVVWTFSGVRPLYDDGASEAKAATREYVFELDGEAGEPPLLSIFGGKITTYRRLAEEALEKLSPWLARLKGKQGWTGKAPLPGGDFPVDGRAALAAELLKDAPFIGEARARRWAATYGTAARDIPAFAKDGSLGEEFGGGLSEAEARHLIANEWALSAEDVLWRRTKLGLVLTLDQRNRFGAWFAEQGAGRPGLRNTGKSCA